MADLLLKALFVARKLKIKEFEAWIKNELEGYGVTDQVPLYRKNYCQIKMRDLRYGWQPIIFASPEKENALNNVNLLQPITEIEKLRGLAKGEITRNLPSELILHLHGTIGQQLPIEQFVPKTAIDKICESVRKIVLEWALSLEEHGILGENMSFSEEEKTKANNSQHIHINHFQGILGNINNSTVEQNLNFTIRKNNLPDLIQALEKCNVEKHDIDALAVAIESEPMPASATKFGSKIASWIGSMVSKATAGTWDISLKVAADVLERFLSNYYGIG